MPSFDPARLSTCNLARALLQLARFLDSAVLQQAGERLLELDKENAALRSRSGMASDIAPSRANPSNA